jgi:hypothetical protein
MRMLCALAVRSHFETAQQNHSAVCRELWSCCPCSSGTGASQVHTNHSNKMNELLSLENSDNVHENAHPRGVQEVGGVRRGGEGVC